MFTCCQEFVKILIVAMQEIKEILRTNEFSSVFSGRLGFCEPAPRITNGPAAA